MKQRLRAMNEDVFERRYTSIPNPHDNGNCSWEHGQIPAGTDYHYVWTWVDGTESDSTYLIPGYHIVNRIGYILTEKPWTDKDEEENLYVKWS